MLANFIDIPDPQLYYSLFYVAAFFISFIILLVEGKKRKLPLLPWLIVISAGYIFFVLGCRLITFSLEDWENVLQNQSLTHATGIVMIGGLLFSVPAIFIVKRLMNLNSAALDAYALIIPIGMCLQRIGCFLTGCCFGAVTNSGLGVHYPQGSSAFHLHYTQGIIPETAINSLAVHPVQLYESFGCLMAAILLWKIRSRIKAPGSLFYTSGLTYYLIRFLTEFFRAEEAHALDVSHWLHLNSIQWTLLALMAGSILIIVYKEKSPLPILKRYSAPPISLRYLIVFLTLNLIFFYASPWLSLTEILVVNIVLLSTGVCLLVELFRSVTVPRFRVAFSAIVIVSFLMMSQTYPEQAANDSTRISYNTISIGGLLGTQNLIIDAVSTTDCDGNAYYTPGKNYEHKYKLAALGFSRTMQTGESRSFTYGLNAYTGTHEENVTGGITSNRPILQTYGFNPFLQTDLRLFAVGVGAHLGDMSFISDYDLDATSIKRYSVYPQLYMRIGHLKYVFGEINLARNFPSSFPGTYFQTSLGIGVNRRSANSGVLRIGTSSSTAVFISPTIPIGNNFVMEPYIGFGEAPFMKTVNSGYDGSTGLVGSLNLHYKFNKKNRQ